MTYTVMATAPLGLEAVVAREVKQLGYECRVLNGKVIYQTDGLGIARSNLWLRCADRVLIIVGEFVAHTFEELFEQTKTLPWTDLLPQNARFPVEGRSVKSQLSSVPACQSIVKKAIVTSMQERYAQEWLEESGDLYAIEVSILNDVVTLTLDTSGPGLHKRGYRTEMGPAPIKETLAAALVLLSRWQAHRPFADPLCGSGTIAIEAAMIARHVAPGINRGFSAENFAFLPKDSFQLAREEARDALLPRGTQPILASDIDSSAVAMARQHAAKAGVFDSITFSVEPIATFFTKLDYGCIVTNPPYGERLSDELTVRQLYKEMGQAARRLPTWSFFIITAHPAFERLFGKQADKNRKLYNGRIECHFYQYLGPLPKREKPVTT